ncbi:hypothetical protein ACLKA6_010235 [Drosophila palustris]
MQCWCSLLVTCHVAEAYFAYGDCCVAVIGLLATNSDHIKSLARDTKCRRACHRRWKHQKLMAQPQGQPQLPPQRHEWVQSGCGKGHGSTGAREQWQWQEATSLEARRRALSGAMGPSPGDTTQKERKLCS